MRRDRNKAEQKEQATRSADAVVGMMDSIAGAIDEEFRMNRAERMLISEPLRELFLDMTPEQLDVVGKYTNPASLVLGLVAWFTRIYRTVQARRAEEERAVLAEGEPEEKAEPLRPTPDSPQLGAKGQKPVIRPAQPGDLRGVFEEVASGPVPVI